MCQKQMRIDIQKGLSVAGGIMDIFLVSFIYFSIMSNFSIVNLNKMIFESKYSEALLHTSL